MQKYMSLSNLDGSNGFSIGGTTASINYFGGSFTSTGDINGDGYDDIIVGNRDADSPTANTTGAINVVFGKASSFTTNFDVSKLDGNNGFAIFGTNKFDNFGASVCAEDINGDGFADILIGAPSVSSGTQNRAGAIYAFFGKASGYPTSFNIPPLDGANGFTIYGNGSNFGWSICVGDINGDGFADIVIGAPDIYHTSITGGAVYIILGESDGFPTSMDLATPLDGSNGFAIYGTNGYHSLGISVAASDINDDGYDDIIIGDPYFGYNAVPGAVYVLFGKPTGFLPIFDLTTLDGSNGFSMYGVNDANWLGYSVGVGDINGDKISDIAIGAPYVNLGSTRDVGAAYFVFGKSTGFPPVFDLSTLDGSNGFAVYGINTYNHLGISVSVGDINGDGFADISVGAVGAGGTGATYQLYGKAVGFPPVFGLSSIDGSNGFIINGTNPGDSFGASVSMGDINGDGCSDIVIAAPREALGNNTDVGATHVILSDCTAIKTPTTSTPTPTASSASSISVGSSYLMMAGALAYLASETIYDCMMSDTKAKPTKAVADTPTRQGSSFMASRSRTLATLASAKTNYPDYPDFSKVAQPESVADNQQLSTRATMSVR